MNALRTFGFDRARILSHPNLRSWCPEGLKRLFHQRLFDGMKESLFRNFDDEHASFIDNRIH